MFHLMTNLMSQNVFFFHSQLPPNLLPRNTCHSLNKLTSPSKGNLKIKTRRRPVDWKCVNTCNSLNKLMSPCEGSSKIKTRRRVRLMVRVEKSPPITLTRPIAHSPSPIVLPRRWREREILPRGDRSCFLGKPRNPKKPSLCSYLFSS